MELSIFMLLIHNPVLFAMRLPTEIGTAKHFGNPGL